jgi:hypothetical protein
MRGLGIVVALVCLALLCFANFTVDQSAEFDAAQATLQQAVGDVVVQADGFAPDPWNVVVKDFECTANCTCSRCMNDAVFVDHRVYQEFLATTPLMQTNRVVETEDVSYVWNGNPNVGDTHTITAYVPDQHR